MHEPTVFEKIVAGEIPCSKLREDDEFIAILDLFPNCEWQTLVIPKTWYDSDIALMPDDVYMRYMTAVRHVINILKISLQVQRVGIIVEWMWVHHAHVKLYPMHGLGSEWKEMIPMEKVWFDKYPGYLTTHTWHMQAKEKLDALADHIRKAVNI